MTRPQVRLLLLVLTAKRIPFTVRRSGSLYTVAFPQDRANDVRMAVGS